MVLASEPMLQTDTIEDIENRAEQVLSDVFGTSKPPLPVDLNKVAANLGLTIKQGTFRSPEIIGFYDRGENTIYVSSADPYARRAFTIAHEIGHRCLHDDKHQETFYRHAEMSLSTEDRQQEKQANWFAASLLMPRELVQEYYRLLPGDIKSLASTFRVSQSAMQYRLGQSKEAAQKLVHMWAVSGL